ncbi:transposase, IS608 family [Gloeothece citriformis PCC 7424]|uniref:Transposase, IS608 family n=1 Tax=Gloeothece citriformis (strain PCC 7424) TaxID=65393 RepID=B7K8F3_GLOC7|nr:RNA-guided endonuclease TnpB family protein [Gloeothece citriformis]ACK69913.1 transposase, IS608 family [Gloeothece citriformis PCC 7424]ACK73631.1 transposase, IS608 family [Gloeothece citriformis PCC 7424]
MTKASSPSFVTELPLVVDSQQEKELLSKFQAARQLYNALLGEAEKRRKLVQKSPIYQEAKATSRTEKKLRNQRFTKARQQYRYSDYDLQAYATIVSNSSKWIADKLDSNTQQTLASRAFRASERILLRKAKKVRFKVPTRFKSVEGKTNKQGIRWKNNHVVWGKLKIRPIINNDPLILHGLNSRIKLVRLLWRELNGKRRWYAQLICEGIPYQKPANYVKEGIVGIDLNISNIAFVGNEKAGLLPFAVNVPTYSKEIRFLQRKMERSRRVLNPHKYYPDFEGKKGRKTVTKKGKVKKGRGKWNNSKTYLKTAQKKRELERRKTAYAKSKNRQIVNEILRHGNQIKTENVSVKGWQKRYGKAILAKSPGFVQSELKRKAENANGSFNLFSTQKTALSQTHLTGSRVKKSLSQRIHVDETGVIMHRDLFSAYLSRFVNDEDNLLLHFAVEQWKRSEPVLLQAWKEFQINCKQVSASESRLCHSSSEQFCTKLEKDIQIANLLRLGRQDISSF